MNVIDNVFGFLIKQPIHKSIRQLRIPTLCILGVCVDIMYRLVAILEVSPAASIAAVGALAAVIVAAMWKGISSLTDVQKDDD